MENNNRTLSFFVSNECFLKLEKLTKKYQLSKTELIKFLIEFFYEIDRLKTAMQTSIDKKEPIKIETDGYGFVLSDEHVQEFSETIQKAVSNLANGVQIVLPKGKKNLRFKRYKQSKAA